MKKRTFVLSLCLLTLWISFTSATTYDPELAEAYHWAYDMGITNKFPIENANMFWSITRAELAKMLANFSQNVLWKAKDTSKSCFFSDIASLDESLKNACIEACQFWIMWQWTQKFRPYDTVSRAEFWTSLSRILWWGVYDGWSPYYTKHLDSLKKEWIMDSISHPNAVKESRWYVMLMLMRSYSKFWTSTSSKASLSSSKITHENSSLFTWWHGDFLKTLQELYEEWHKNQKSWLYTFSYISSNSGGDSVYWLQMVDLDDFDYTSYLNWDYSSLLPLYASSWDAEIKSNPWIKGFYDFRSFIYLDLSFSGSVLVDRKVVDKITKESLGKTTIETLNKKYNYEASHNVNQLNIDKDNINLSELKENDIYQYTLSSWNHMFPKFTNDLDKNVIFYTKNNMFNFDSFKYDSEVLLIGDSEGGWFGFSSNDSTYNIFYKTVSVDELLKEIWEDNIVYLSKYKSWDQVSFRLEETREDDWSISKSWSLGIYLYNDTKKVLTVKILNELFGEMEEKDVAEIKPGWIYERYWAADAFLLLN